MLGRVLCWHHTALAPLPLCRAHESRCTAFRPQKAGQCRQSMRCQASKDADDLQLVKREGALLACPSTCIFMKTFTTYSAIIITSGSRCKILIACHAKVQGSGLLYISSLLVCHP